MNVNAIRIREKYMKVNAIRIRVNTRISMILESEKIHESQCYQDKRKYKNINAIRIRENT